MPLAASDIIQAYLSDSADLFLKDIKVAPSDKSDYIIRGKVPARPATAAALHGKQKLRYGRGRRRRLILCPPTTQKDRALFYKTKTAVKEKINTSKPPSVEALNSLFTIQRAVAQMPKLMVESSSDICHKYNMINK